jgi:dihydroflavonol-4-reductase
MSVLVTGATGFLGSHLCRALIREGYEVSAFHRAESDTARIAGLQLAEVIGDVTDAESVSRAIDGHEFIIHAAAHAAYWNRAREVQARVNIDGTRNVVAACLASGVKRLLYVSSTVAIGVPARGTTPADETCSFNLERAGVAYPVSKHKAEEAVLAGCEAGLDAVIVNPSSVFGPHGRRYRGSEMIEKARARQIVPYYLGGRNIVHVDDVVNGILRAMARGVAGERYILGGENVTYQQIARIAAECLGSRPVFVPVYPFVTAAISTVLEAVGAVTKRRPWITRDVHTFAGLNQFYSSAKAERQLGYQARPFRAIVEDYLTWLGTSKTHE